MVNSIATRLSKTPTESWDRESRKSSLEVDSSSGDFFPVDSFDDVDELTVDGEAVPVTVGCEGANLKRRTPVPSIEGKNHLRRDNGASKDEPG